MKNRMRMRLTIILFMALVLGSVASAEQQQKKPQGLPPQYKQQPVEMTFEKISPDIYQIKGGRGANAGVIIGQKEIMVIDAKMNEDSAKQMLDEIKKMADVPVTVLALTHSDGDHVIGITAFPADIKIFAQEETKRYMEEEFKDPEQRACLPRIKTFTSGGPEYDLGGRKVRLLYFGPAHTSGDIVVYIPEEKVAFLGDLYFADRDPLVHRHKNGNSFGLVKVLQSVLALDAETFLSGHANRATRADVEGLIQSIQEKHARIKALIADGKTLDDVKKEFGIREQVPAPPPGSRRFLSLPEVIWLELTEK